ncbi:hypothetical protein ACIBLA_05045 [Streptomyces sp. NPDC050433]|uniref:MmyB family transcriptional regulator n=1 Tax=Streptomyces sp. NPDC050433 TaxID=3365615 RepID=UPI003795F5A1
MDGQKTFHHPDVGTTTLSYQSMQIEGSTGQRLGVFTAEPGTQDYEAIGLLDDMAEHRSERSAVEPTG